VDHHASGDDLSTEGGDQQTISVQFLEDDKARTIPTFKNAVVQVYTFAHDPLLAIYNDSLNWMSPAIPRQSGSTTSAGRPIVTTLRKYRFRRFQRPKSTPWKVTKRV
jgi:hypothetical protein